MERARKIGDEMYPRVCALLDDGHRKFPRQFDILTKPLRGNYSGSTWARKICLDSRRLEEFRSTPAGFDQLLIHEMAHVAQEYQRPILGPWLVSGHNPPSYWTEGIADYVAFKLGPTNGWDCPECGLIFPSYHYGYGCAGAFLFYVEKTCNSNIVRQLNAALRDAPYSDDFFTKATGRTLPKLWSEFEQTAAFTPNARRMEALQQTLGYIDGKPPKDITQRFDAYLEQHADASTQELLRPLTDTGVGIQLRLAAYLYLTQPGGSAEAFMLKLKKEKKAPGFAELEHGHIHHYLTPRDLELTYPATRNFTANKDGDLSTYHYIVSRASAEANWKLQRAWRTAADGHLAEEYPIP